MLIDSQQLLFNFHFFLQIVIPFVLLIVLNIRTYQKIVEFEQTLNNPVTVKFQNKRSTKSMASNIEVSNNETNFEMVELVGVDEQDQEIQSNQNIDFISKIRSFRGSKHLSIHREKRGKKICIKSVVP